MRHVKVILWAVGAILLIAGATSVDRGWAGLQGSNWAQVQSGTYQSLHGVWGLSSSEVWAVGEGGLVLRFNGTLWTPQISTTNEALYAVGGTSGSDVYAVGSRGTILHYDGSSWRSVSPYGGPKDNLLAVWGAAPNDVFAVGENGTILHFDGSDWKLQPTNIPNPLFTVWGRSPEEVYAVGAGGALLRYEGSTWRQMRFDGGGQYALRAVWSSSAGGLYVLGTETTTMAIPQQDYTSYSTNATSRVFRFAGGSWRTEPGEAKLISPLIVACVVSGDDVYAVAPSSGPTTQHNAVLAHFDGAGWRVTRTRLPSLSLHALWASPEGVLFAVGAAGVVVQGTL